MTEPRSMEPMSTICHGAGLVFKFMKVDETAPSRSPACRWTLSGLRNIPTPFLSDSLEPTFK